jgi:hypothetical protein
MWIKPSEAGRILAMHPDTVARKVEAGELRVAVSRSDSGHRRYSRADCERIAKGLPADEQLERHLGYIQRELSDMGLVLPVADIHELYGAERALLGELDQYGSDTQTDEQVSHVISQLLTGRDTPVIGEGDRVYHAWRQRLEAAALERGWQLTQEPEDQTIDWSTQPLGPGERESSWGYGGGAGKARFGSTDELGTMQMGPRGLVPVRLAKNKVSPPYGEAEIPLFFGTGFDQQAAAMRVADLDRDVLIEGATGQGKYLLTDSPHAIVIAGTRPLDAWQRWLAEDKERTVEIIECERREHYEREVRDLTADSERVTAVHAIVIRHASTYSFFRREGESMICISGESNPAAPDTASGAGSLLHHASARLHVSSVQDSTRRYLEASHRRPRRWWHRLWRRS